MKMISDDVWMNKWVKENESDLVMNEWKKMNERKWIEAWMKEWGKEWGNRYYMASYGRKRRIILAVYVGYQELLSLNQFPSPTQFARLLVRKISSPDRLSFYPVFLGWGGGNHSFIQSLRIWWPALQIC